MIFGAVAMQYNLFDFRDPKDGLCELTNTISFKFWPYADLEADCNSWVNSFLHWASERNLLSYLHRKGISSAYQACSTEEFPTIQ